MISLQAAGSLPERNREAGMGCESQQGRGHLSGAAGLAGRDLPPKLNFNPAHKSSSKSLPATTSPQLLLHGRTGIRDRAVPSPLVAIGLKGQPVSGSRAVASGRLRASWATDHRGQQRAWSGCPE